MTRSNDLEFALVFDVFIFGKIVDNSNSIVNWLMLSTIGAP